MRAFILVCALFAVANANLYSKNRFYKLLNLYQQPKWYGNQIGGQWDVYGDDYGYGIDDVDQYGGDYDDMLTSTEYDQVGDLYGQQGVWGTDDSTPYYGGCNSWQGQGQCFRDMEEMGQEDEEECQTTSCLLRRQQLLGGGDSDNIWYGDNDLLEDDLDIRGTGGYSALKEVQHANCKLASRLYKETKEDKDDKNTVVSPLSIQLALAALTKGATGNTKRQINRVIGGSLNNKERRHIFNKLARQVKRQWGSELSGQFGNQWTSTRINPVTVIAINTRTPAQQWFIQSVVNSLPGVRVKHCNFHNQPRVCRKMINNMVARKTNMKINQIVPRDAITDNTKMVLVNALEMKAPWGRQMRKHVTKSAKFFPLETNKVKIVEVMETEGRFKYYEDELVKIVGIPTQQKEMTLYTIVPKHKDGLTAVEKLHLQDGVQLKHLLEKTDRHTRRVGVQLPKFQIKHKIDVRRSLRREGITDCFDPMRAQFDRITGVQSEFSTIGGYDTLGLDGGLNTRFGDEYETTAFGGQQLGVFGEKLHLNKFIHQCTIKISENGITSATQLDNIEQYDQLDSFKLGRVGGSVGFGGRWGGYDDIDRQMSSFDDDEIRGLFGGFDLMSGRKMVKANRAFAFVLKHNPSKQLVMVGRVIDAAQKKVHGGFQSIDQL